MSVAFLSRPDRPPAVALPRLALPAPDERPRLVVARAAEAASLAALHDKLDAMRIASDPARREAGDPLVAIWLDSPAEPALEAAAAADVLLLGGGWALLETVLSRLDPLAGATRATRLAALSGLPGVWLPRGGARGESDPDFLPGGAPLSA
jgi:hypothetical protein